MDIIPQVFTDYLAVTFSPDDVHRVLPQLLDIACLAGAFSAGEGLLRFGLPIVGKSYGLLSYGTKYGVFRVSLSGAALGALRGCNLFLPFLAALASVPHRLTRLDAACDLSADGPAVIASLWLAVRAGQVQLSRKALALSDCNKLVSASLAPGDSRDTGTVYLGRRVHDIHARVYDKRQERLSAGKEDPGPLVRYELTFTRKFPASMRDAANPEALFWKYAGRTLLPVPAHVQEWVPVDTDDLGFDLPVRVRDPFRMLQDLLERSDDVRRLLSLADELGPGGRQLLCTRLKRAGLDVRLPSRRDDPVAWDAAHPLLMQEGD